MRSPRAVALLATLACSALGLLVASEACNGSGTTPVCTFPDGADDPDAGCGEIISLDGESEGSSVMDASMTDTSTQDVTHPLDAADTGLHDAAGPDASDGSDSSDSHDAADAHDAKG